MKTQYTFMLKKIGKISLFCLLTWSYDKHSLAQTSPVSNIFHGPKSVRAIEVLLYFVAYVVTVTHLLFHSSEYLK